MSASLPPVREQVKTIDVSAVASELGHDGGWSWTLAPNAVPGTSQLADDKVAVLRGAFAATIWQHGLVSDAMVASTHLRFAGHSEEGLGEVPTEQQLADVLATFVMKLEVERANAPPAAAPAAPAAAAEGVVHGLPPPPPSDVLPANVASISPRSSRL